MSCSPLRLVPAQALPFLCFAKEKEAKERRLRAQVWLRQTSLTAHGFSGGLATCGCAASGMQALIPRKTALRSAVPAGGAALYACGEFSVLKFAH